MFRSECTGQRDVPIESERFALAFRSLNILPLSGQSPDKSELGRSTGSAAPAAFAASALMLLSKRGRRSLAGVSGNVTEGHTWNREIHAERDPIDSM
jgi:hypothetical protein